MPSHLKKTLISAATLSAFAVAIAFFLRQKKVERPAITFLTFDDPEFQVSREALKENNPPCQIAYHGVHKSPQEHLFALGKLDCEGSMRSLLLKSTDDGAHWTELPPSFVGSQVFFLQFITATEAYAIASHTREGPGEDTLLKSTDGGATWNATTTIPKGPTPWLAALHSFTATTQALTATFLLPSDSGKDTLWVVQSHDKGSSFSAPKEASESEKMSFEDTGELQDNPAVKYKTLPVSVDFSSVHLVK